MTYAQFGMNCRPFATGPDPAAFYAAPDHDEMLTRLTAALTDDEPYVAVVGEPGVGKTLLAHVALERLGDDVSVAFVTNCHCERRADLLQAVLYDLGLPYAGRPEQELRLALTDSAMKNHLDGRRTLLVLDEAQSLTPTLLEEVRVLGNLETPHGRAVQVLLIGQPELLDALERPETALLSQRLSVRLRVSPFGLRDAAEYVAFQLRRAGADPAAVMTDEAMEVLARGSRGIPRLPNQAGAATLALAASAGQDVADAETATEALAGLPHAGPIADEPLFAPIGVAEPVHVGDDDAAVWARPQRFLFAAPPTP